MWRRYQSPREPGCLAKKPDKGGRRRQLDASRNSTGPAFSPKWRTSRGTWGRVQLEFGDGARRVRTMRRQFYSMLYGWFTSFRRSAGFFFSHQLYHTSLNAGDNTEIGAACQSS